MNNPESLRTQLIDALVKNDRFTGMMNAQYVAEALFDEALWPVLQAAMRSGELLVSRNTMEQKPVHKALTDFMEGFLTLATVVKIDEKTISRAGLLKIFFEVEANVQKALADAKALPF